MSNDDEMITILDGELSGYGRDIDNAMEIMFLESLNEEKRELAEEAMKKQDPKAYEEFLIWVEKKWPNYKKELNL
ncbi:hypothetical protein MBCUT_10170 [Methanobrevibacter cuticularis]|uniref:Uncharacterized protein n=1 Tax=Methanobrevibacter cuticularis TaxID=47311 RepID=A0A166E0S1_9EURY|nr:hypothetical protein [Methanobrevibacter cuticularis]KZX16151.1 hypothetical protein MBCUT_10170 [Methanobrevibacter cuticularis]